MRSNAECIETQHQDLKATHETVKRSNWGAKFLQLKTEFDGVTSDVNYYKHQNLILKSDIESVKVAEKAAQFDRENFLGTVDMDLKDRGLEIEGLERQNFWLGAQVEVWRKEIGRFEARCGEVLEENAELLVAIKGVREAKEGREAEYWENFYGFENEVAHLRKIIDDLQGNVSDVKKAFNDEGGVNLGLEKSVCNLEGLIGVTRIGMFLPDFEADKEGGFADSYMGCGIPMSTRSGRRSTFLKPSFRNLDRFPSIIDQSDMGPLPETFQDESQFADDGPIKKLQLLTVPTKNMTVVVLPPKGIRSVMESPD
jgi:hypothetical protein